MTKADIRAQIAKQKKALGIQALERMSTDIFRKIQTLDIFREAKSVGAYMPLLDEVDITPLLSFGSLGELALPLGAGFPGRVSSPSEPEYTGKKFYIPAFDETSGSYRMARLTTELKKGRFGIMEPAVPVFATADELDLILVPGVAFDRAGNRIGRGGGFYDRLLPRYRAVRAGICFGFQCLEALPAEKHDTRMDWLITDEQILKTAMNS